MTRKTDFTFHRLQKIYLLLLSLILAALSPTLGVILKEEPTSTEVSYGDSVTLRCAVEGDLEDVSVFWWNINTSRALSANTRISPLNNFLSEEQKNRYSISGNSSNGEFYLHIRDVTVEDRASFQCRTWDGTRWIFSRKVSINAIRETPVCKLHANLPVNVNDTVILSCRSFSTDPTVQLHWVSRGTLLKSSSSSSVQLTIQRVLTESDYDVPFMCMQTGAFQQKVCDIVPLHRQISVIVQERITSVYDGDNASFHCTTGFVKDSLLFTWYINGNVVPEETTDYLEFPATLSNNGSIVTCMVQDAVSGLMGENSALMLVGPRPSSATVSPTTSNAATKNILTTPSGLYNSKHDPNYSSLNAFTTSKELLETEHENRSNISGKTTVTGRTTPPVFFEEIEIENPRVDGSGKASDPHNFMLAFIIGSVVIGTLLIIVIAMMLLFIVHQTKQRHLDRNRADGEKNINDDENVPLGATESLDPNAGIIHRTQRSTKGKRIKETDVDYAILDPDAVEEDDTLSDFRICDELLDVHGEYSTPDSHNHETLHRSYSAGIRDSIVSSVSAYAIAPLPPATVSNKTPMTTTSQQRSASCRSLQRPLPAEPVVKATPKRYTYIAPLEVRNDSNDRVNADHTSPPVSPHVSREHRKNCNLDALGEEDYAEINDIDQKSSAQLTQEQKTDNDITRLKSESERSTTPSVESQEADSALGSGSSMEALTLGDECLYATIGEEQSQNKVNHSKEPVDSSSSPNKDLDDMVIVSLKDIEEAKTEQSNQTPNSVKSKVPVYAKVDKSKKRQQSVNSVKSGMPKSPKSPKDKVGKTLSWQSWLENVVSHGSTDTKKHSVMEDGNKSQTAAYATVWPHEQVTGAS